MKAMLCHPIQRYKFESNSQHNPLCLEFFVCCVIRYKDTNLKAIHNLTVFLLGSERLCHPIQRYKFESNSQL